MWHLLSDRTGHSVPLEGISLYKCYQGVHFSFWKCCTALWGGGGRPDSSLQADPTEPQRAVLSPSLQVLK